MKVYCPLNLNNPLCTGASVYGWVNLQTNEIFICAFQKPPRLKEGGSEECAIVGQLTACSPQSRSSKQPADHSSLLFPLPRSHHCIRLKLDAWPLSSGNNPVVIYYRVHREFASSCDFSAPFNSTPLNHIKRASILSFNQDGQFMQLTRFQRLISRCWQRISQLPAIRIARQTAAKHSLRQFCAHSGVLEQFFQRKDSVEQMYRFLLLNDVSVSDSARLRYRNGVILAVVDLLLGVAAGMLLLAYAEDVLDGTNRAIHAFTIQFFEEYLDWFMGWPAGFKLNANLTRFCGRFFLVLVTGWKTAVFSNWLLLSHDALARFGFLRHFGLSMLVGVAMDYWSVATLHILGCYRLIAVCYRGYFVTMLSLFRLLQGRKWNVLRHRVDRAEYSMGQLLVGMLFFAILFCTLPTIVAYYLLFLATHLFVVAVRCGLESVLVVLNEFPVYFLLLKTVSSPSLTRGIKLIPHTLTSHPPSFRLLLEPQPLMHLFSSLGQQLFRRWGSFLLPSNWSNMVVGRPFDAKRW